MMFDMGYEQTDSLFGFNDTGSDCEVMSHSPLLSFAASIYN